MKKVSKSQLSHKNEILTELRDTQQDLSNAVDDYNAAIKRAWEELSDKIDKANEARENARAWASEILEEAQNYFDGKGEEWQESDKGQNYSQFIDEYDSLELVDVDIGQPDEVEVPESVDESFDSLPDEVEGE